MYKDFKLIRYKIHRKPIESVFKKILSVFSLGKFDKYKDKYDDIFHLFIVFEMRKGDQTHFILTEKTPNIVIESRSGLEANSKSSIEALVQGDHTFGEMIANTKALMGDSFSRYDPKTNNCQVYIKDLLNSIGDHRYDDFIYQPVDDILSGFAQKTATAVTSLGHLVGRLTGKGVEPN